jgi:hypothetical protein
MNDAHAYEMQCNYGSQTLEVLQLHPKSPLKHVKTKDMYKTELKK